MNEKKTISIDQNLFKVTPSSKKKEKKIKSEKMAQVKPKSVKELLLQKLKEYKKQKKRENNKQNSFVPSNSIISNSFMETIQKKRNKTEQNIHVDSMVENDISNTEQSNQVIVPSIISTEPSTIVSPVQLPQPTPSSIVATVQLPQSTPSINSPLPYSNLKNSNLPTFRQWKQQTQKNIMKPKREKVNISKKMIVGLNKTKKKVGIFLKNNKMKQDIENSIIEMKKTKLKTLKSYLKKKNLIQYGTSAPTDLLKEIYISSNLCGGINNINGSVIIDNYYNDNL
tara:strand:- start:28 stop:876 length:849 start_codon:yes stop_codon:yes gene_type:complete